MVAKLRADTHINFIEVSKLQIWDVELAEGSLDGWNTTAGARRNGFSFLSSSF
jgi:hypothetical protein